MPVTEGPVDSIVFDRVEIDVAGHRLLVDGKPVPLERKAFAVLVLLARSPGRVFSRDEILDAVWQHRHVTPGVLNRIVTLLRHALGDDGAQHQYLHTVHGVGYRFDARVHASADAADLAAASTGPTPAGAGTEGGQAVAAADGAAPGDTQQPAARRWRGIWIAVPVLAVILLAAWLQRAAPPSTPTLVVLPLHAVGTERDEAVLAEGLSEELITRLTRIDGLRLISSASATLAQSSKLDFPQLVEKLHVTHVLEGSLREAGDELRVDLRLVEVPGGHALWAQAYDRKISNVLALEGDIAQAVAQSLTLRLGLGGAQPSARDTDPALYLQYLHARQLYRTGARDAAVAELTALIGKAPDYARAHATLAFVLATNLRYYATPAEELDRAGREAERAQALDPNLAETQTALAILACRNAEWLRCDELFKRALVLDPSDSDARVTHAYWLAGLGYVDAAMSQAEMAWRSDPLSLPTNFVRGRLLDTIDRHDEAEPILSRYGTVYARWFNAVWRRDWQRAHALAEEMPQPEGWRESSLAVVDALSDPSSWPRATALIDASEVHQGRANFTRVMAPHPDYAKVIAGLEPTLRNGFPSYYLLLWMPEYAALRRDPAFQDFLRRTRMIDYWRTAGWPPQCTPAGAGAVCR